MRNGIEADTEGARKSCCSASDARDASLVADQLGVPFYSLNIADGFSRLLDYFASEYTAGRTPSPCVHCNGWLKFGALLQSARECGAEAVATGHYARVDAHRTAAGAEYHRLRRAVDLDKDQSYFLFSLSQEQLAATQFPLGELTKPEVREIARRGGLPVQDKPESQEICFAPSGDYGKVVERVTGEEARPGPIVDESGRELGTHRGTIHYTIGQRRGLGVALGEPHYVVAIDPETATVVLGPVESLLENEARIENVHWIAPIAEGEDSIRVEARIRHRHPPAAASVIPGPARTARVRFDEPQRAITPGQAAVFLRGDEVVGGGWIAGGAKAPDLEAENGAEASATGSPSDSFPV